MNKRNIFRNSCSAWICAIPIRMISFEWDKYDFLFYEGLTVNISKINVFFIKWGVFTDNRIGFSFLTDATFPL